MQYVWFTNPSDAEWPVGDARQHGDPSVSPQSGGFGAHMPQWIHDSFAGGTAVIMQ